MSICLSGSGALRTCLFGWCGVFLSTLAFYALLTNPKVLPDTLGSGIVLAWGLGILLNFSIFLLVSARSAVRTLAMAADVRAAISLGDQKEAQSKLEKLESFVRGRYGLS